MDSNLTSLQIPVGLPYYLGPFTPNLTNPTNSYKFLFNRITETFYRILDWDKPHNLCVYNIVKS